MSILIGVCFGRLLEGILLWGLMYPLRKNAGGFHASTRMRCMLLSVGMLIVTFACLIRYNWPRTVYIFITAVSFLVILFLAPVENPNKRLDNAERKVYGRRTRIILTSVSLEEALQDPTFDINHVDTNESIMPRSTYWNVWGEREYRKSDNTARPIGYSEHVSNGTVLNTFHYTRTYLDGGILGGKKGDSDRQWGYKTVQATGTYCMMDVWDTCIHKVKYGTED